MAIRNPQSAIRNPQSAIRNPQSHVLVADVGGTHISIAVFAHYGNGKLQAVRHKTFRSRTVQDFPALLSKFLKEEGRDLTPAVRQACIDFAGPVGPKRDKGTITNLGWGFTAREVFDAIPVEELTLLNDFEAVGFGLEVLLANCPEAFVRLSPAGKLPGQNGRKPTAVVIGAGTGLGTSILIEDVRTGKYRPIPGEGGHVDFEAVDELEFRAAGWIRKHINRSPGNPMDRERIVSGPGLVNLYRALSELEPGDGNPRIAEEVVKADVYDRPAVIIQHAGRDTRCRRTLDIWLRCYARAAKNSAIFPLTPGGVFLAGGIAAKILPEMQSGLFMKEFMRCDIPNIRSLLKRTPVFIVTDYRIGLFGCANVALNFFNEMGLRRTK